MNKNNIAEQLVKLADAEAENQNHLSGILKYSEAIGLSPDNPHYLTKRCKSLIVIEKFQLAIQDVTKAIDIDNNFKLAYYTLMNIYLLLGATEKVEETIKEFRNIAPNIKSINSNQVRKLKKLKKLNDDLKCFLANDNQHQALMSMNEALTIAPASTHLLYLKTKYLVAKRKFKEAKDTGSRLNKVLCEDLDIVKALKLYYDGNVIQCFNLLNVFPETTCKEDPDEPISKLYLKNLAQLVDKLILGKQKFIC